MDRNASYQSGRPGRPSLRQQTGTASTLRPRVSRFQTAGTSGTTGTAGTAGTTRNPDEGYSLAKTNAQTRGGPIRDTYVSEEYRRLNPQYEKQADQPTFSLGSNLPRTVRKWQNKKKGDSKGSKSGTPGIETGEKGDSEAAPQLQDTDQRRKENEPSRPENQEPEQQGSKQSEPQNRGDGQSAGPMMRQFSAQDKDGRDLGVIGDEAVMSPGSDTTLTEDDVAAGEEAMQHFNTWALIRSKFQDALGEWLGTTIFVALGVSANLAVATSSEPTGTYQSMYWAWGMAVMLGIYISGGSSGGHLNPAISIALSVYRGFPARKLPTFIFFQILGAFTGAIIAIAIYRDAILYVDGGLIPASTGIKIYTQPQEWVKPATAFFTEALGTGIMTCSVLALGDDSNSPPGAGMHAFIIGLLVMTLLMSLGANTGGMLNPARDLGPRLAAMAMGYGTEVFNAGHAWWIWGGWVATTTGSLLGAMVYDACIFKGGESPVNFSSRKWQNKGNEAKRDFFHVFRQHDKAKGLEQQMENGDA